MENDYLLDTNMETISPPSSPKDQSPNSFSRDLIGRLGIISQGSETVINKAQNSNKCQSACIEVLICIYKQTDDECFYLWDTIRLNFK